MKSIQGGKSLLRTTTMVQVPVRFWAFEELKERVKNTVTLLAIVAAIVALYAVMFVGFYRWTHYAPIFPPQDAGGLPILPPLE